MNANNTILLAEDEALVRGMVATLLQDQGFKVLEAANGADALRLVEEYTAGEVRLLISDIIMPQMDGIELAARFRVMFPNAGILLISGYADRPDIQEALSKPGVRFLPKPFAPQALLEIVREAMNPSGPDV